jgi:hypothetical protein
MRVMQLEDSTFWAGSWPVARNMAATMFEAWALLPPIEPATAEPTRFFWMFRSTSDATVVCRASERARHEAETPNTGTRAHHTRPRKRACVYLEDFLDDAFLNDGLGDDRLASALEPVDSGGLLVRAVVARQRQDLNVGEVVCVCDRTVACEQESERIASDCVQQCKSAGVPVMTSSAFSTPLEIMFMPMASPVALLKRRKRVLPARPVLICTRAL